MAAQPIASLPPIEIGRVPGTSARVHPSIADKSATAAGLNCRARVPHLQASKAGWAQ